MCQADYLNWPLQKPSEVDAITLPISQMGLYKKLNTPEGPVLYGIVVRWLSTPLSAPQPSYQFGEVGDRALKTHLALQGLSSLVNL